MNALTGLLRAALADATSGQDADFPNLFERVDRGFDSAPASSMFPSLSRATLPSFVDTGLGAALSTELRDRLLEASALEILRNLMPSSRGRSRRSAGAASDQKLMPADYRTSRPSSAGSGVQRATPAVPSSSGILGNILGQGFESTSYSALAEAARDPQYLANSVQNGLGAGAASNAQAVAAANALLAAYRRQLASLAGTISEAQTTGTQAADAALAAVRGNPSPYQNIQLQMGQQASNPLEDYMRRLGTSTSQADATLGLINAQNNSSNAALTQLAQNLNTMNQNAQAGTISDIERSKQAFIQGLAQQRASEELALKNYYGSRGVRV